MKKILGWLIIIIMSILILFFVLTLIFIISGQISYDTELEMTISELFGVMAAYAIVIALLILGLRYGIKKIRPIKQIDTIEFDEKLELNLNGKIEYIDYRNLILEQSLKKPIYLFFLGIIIIFLISILINIDNINSLKEVDSLLYLIPIVILLTPILTLFQVKKLYNTNTIFQERLNYKINNESITIKGDTIDSVHKWQHFYRIRETKKFFVLNHGKMVATLLDKKMFNDIQLEIFRRFLKSLPITV